MSAFRRLSLGMRLMFGAVWLVSAAYGVIAYVPFTYAQVIEGRLSDALLAFAAHHGMFVSVASIALAIALWDRLRRKDPGAGVVVFATVAVSGLLALIPVLASLKNEPRSLWIGLAMTLPLFGLAALDIGDARRRIRWTQVENVAHADARLWWSCLIASLVAWIVYTGISLMRAGSPAIAGQLLWSLPAHLTLFGGAFVMAMLGAGVALMAKRTAEAEFWIASLILWAALVLLIARVVLRPIAFGGGLAWITAAIVAAAIIAMWASLALQIRARAGVATERGLDALFNPSGRTRAMWASAVAFGMLAAACVIATRGMAAMDWNFLGQEVIAATVYLIALAMSYGAIRPSRVGAGSGIALACIAPIAFALVYAHTDHRRADETANANPSFRLLQSALVPTIDGAAAKDGLYEFLIANTNLPRERNVAPLDVRLADSLSKTSVPLPHIFIVVVDSLRRDYVAPFNPAVTFTPKLAAFASEGVAFTNAFTRYGATGLAEPSIWVGGMMLHKQYVEPFAPQNSLAKLLTAEEYTPFVSVDSILKVTLPSNLPRLVELDRGRATKDYNLCGSLAELQSQITTAGAARMFSYTQAQDLHISTITREGSTVPGGGSYPGFNAPYAARLARLDACFGTFTDALKASGLYDSSVVIFTADHGDSLGEDGRFGHAYTVFPEVMRIPLIIKLPGDQSRIAANRDALVFSTDITPTLFDLLGHTPTLNEFPFGRSLARPIRPSAGELVGSSYGAVYGWLTQNGRRLYIVDAVNFQDYVYDLGQGTAGVRTSADAAERDSSRKAIHDGVAAIAKTYHFAAR